MDSWMSYVYTGNTAQGPWKVQHTNGVTGSSMRYSLTPGRFKWLKSSTEEGIQRIGEWAKARGLPPPPGEVRPALWAVEPPGQQPMRYVRAAMVARLKAGALGAGIASRAVQPAHTVDK